MKQFELNARSVFIGFIEELRKHIDFEKDSGVDIDKCGSRTWTKVVKKSFYKLGETKRFKVWSTEHGGEYLLDVLWVSEEEKTNGPVLGVESEWGNVQEVEDDFYKLMYVKCKLKIMVYNSTSDKKESEFLDKFKKWLADFNLHQPGDQYLFIDITDFEPYSIIGRAFTVPEGDIVDKKSIKFYEVGISGWEKEYKNYCKVK